MKDFAPRFLPLRRKSQGAAPSSTHPGPKKMFRRRFSASFRIGFSLKPRDRRRGVNPMAPRTAQPWPESDRFEGTPHPRETYGFFGNAEAERALVLSYFAGRLPHALILCGPPGIGKATLAWRLARFVLVNPDPNSVPQAERTNLFVPESHFVS